ncbi:MAG TPA: ergothioneine biosynthesis protein EgtB [Gemmatimonadaceae bacterium]
MSVIEYHGLIRSSLADLLADARERTLLLVSTVSEADLRKQHDPLMGPILWDLGHIAHFEKLWLGRNLDGPIEFVEMPGLFNPFEHPRGVRGALPLPTLDDTLARMREIRARVLERLAHADVDSPNPLLRDGYVYRMVAQHEFQHDETILQTLQLERDEPYHPARRIEPPRGAAPAAPGAMVRVPGGEVWIGTDDRTAAYDNERPRHRRTLAPYWIDVTPVTNEQYVRFIEANGYATRAWWSDAGWAWLCATEARAPKYWRREGGEWRTRAMDRAAPLDPLAPVCHVCYHEAEAFARWAGKRLPTEAEWEAAAAWDFTAGEWRAYPWGDEPPTPAHANLDQLAFGVAQVGAHPLGVSPVGCHGMIGDVWEWTSTDFHGYPGYESFPYPEYSEAFFGSEYKVLRGGSWATRPGAIRNSFRNWDYPIRRQIFAGFRCARDD